MRITITSYGAGHPGQDPVEADFTLDLRRSLRNPHHDPAMRQLTGLDEVVRRHVLATRGARDLIGHATDAAFDLAAATGRDIEVATVCTGGRHRSVAIAEEIAAVLRARGAQVRVIHRDIGKPLLSNRTHQPAAGGGA